VLRGDVYRLELPPGVGHEQHGERFGVVVQADEMLPRSVVLVAPTSRSARSASFRPEIDVNGEQTKVLVERLGAADVGRLGDLAGHLSREELCGIDDALDRARTPVGRATRTSGGPRRSGWWADIGLTILVTALVAATTGDPDGVRNSDGVSRE
jgi:mRNA interferase MazF